MPVRLTRLAGTFLSAERPAAAVSDGPPSIPKSARGRSGGILCLDVGAQGSCQIIPQYSLWPLPFLKNHHPLQPGMVIFDSPLRVSTYFICHKKVSFHVNIFNITTLEKHRLSVILDTSRISGEGKQPPYNTGSPD